MQKKLFFALDFYHRRKEDGYAMLYGKTGRPNFSVARLLGLCLLQEWNDFSDQEALDTFSFDIRWRYALDVNDDEDYLSRRSLGSSIVVVEDAA